MNYIKQLNSFYDWLIYNSMPTGAIALWHALVAVNNKAGWAKEFTVANIVLQGMTGLSRQGIDKSRNILIQKGLITYKKGSSNKAGKYKISNLEYKKVGTEMNTVVANEYTQRKLHSGTLNKENKNKENNIIHLSHTHYNNTQGGLCDDPRYKELI